MPLNTAPSLALCCQNLHRPAFSVNTGIWTCGPPPPIRGWFE